MPTYNHTQKLPIKSIDVAKAIIQSDKFTKKEKKCLKALKYAALVAALLANSACTTGLGVLSFNPEIHRIYNDRVRIEQGYKHGGITNQDRRELTSLIEREVN